MRSPAVALNAAEGGRKLVGKKRYTIRDIAKMAKVSHTTVSRVLNNAPRVREETRRRILELVSILDYRPHARARAFASKRSHLLGLLVSDISNPFGVNLRLQPKVGRYWRKAQPFMNTEAIIRYMIFLSLMHPKTKMRSLVRFIML